MNIARTPPSGDELASMYIDAGWINNPNPEIMTRSVASGSEWFVARDEYGAALGIGRVITDYARYAFIVDVIVLAKRRSAGIGTAIMNEIISECRRLGIDSVNLWPSIGKAPFYEKLGFYALPPEQPHMKLKRGI